MARKVSVWWLLLRIIAGACLATFMLLTIQDVTKILGYLQEASGNYDDAWNRNTTTTTTTTVPTNPQQEQQQQPPLKLDALTQLENISSIVNMKKEGPPVIYHCGLEGNGRTEAASVLPDVFPEYVFQIMAPGPKPRDRGPWYWNYSKEGMREYDIFFAAVDIPCDAFVERWIHRAFRGKTLYITGESEDAPTTLDKNGKSMVYLGNVAPDFHPQALPLYYLQYVWWHLFHKQGNDQLIHHEQKPRGTGTHFLIYAANNCVHFRNQAFDALSKIGLVHAGGRCRGAGAAVNATRIRTKVSLGNWWDNVHVYREYRFCLVMEHVQKDGYVTEKILLAFAAGCIPIYYGTTRIFDLFNVNAFVFYDISNPTRALEQVAFLEQNTTAYMEMMDQPILAHGNATIETYFSFHETIGHGKLKHQIRKRLGLNKYTFVNKR